MRAFWLTLSVVIPCTLFGGNLTLVNDSPYPLRVVVLAQDGSVLGNEELLPQQTKNWSGGWTGGHESETPYTVHWFCKAQGNDFSVCTGIPSGAMVVAQTCPGNKICPIPKKKEEGEASDKTSPPQEFENVY